MTSKLADAAKAVIEAEELLGAAREAEIASQRVLEHATRGRIHAGKRREDAQGKLDAARMQLISVAA